MDDDTFEDEVSNAESVLDNETPENPETKVVPTEQVKTPKDQTSTENTSEKIVGMGFDYDYAQDKDESNSVKTFTVPEDEPELDDLLPQLTKEPVTKILIRSNETIFITKLLADLFTIPPPQILNCCT